MLLPTKYLEDVRLRNNQLFIYDSDTGDYLDVIDNFLSLTYEWSVTKIGKLSAKISLTTTRQEKLDALLAKDNIILVNNDEALCYILQNEEYVADEVKKESVVNILAVQAKVLALRVPIFPEPNSYRKFNNVEAETIIRDLVDENIINNTAYTEYNLPNLVLEPAKVTPLGSLTTDQYRYQYLHEVIFTLLYSSRLIWNIRFDRANRQFVLEIDEGVDRTEGQSVNTRAIFSIEFNNLLSESYKRNRIDVYNTALVLGQGIGSLRDVELVNPTAVSGRNMRTLVVDARDIGLGLNSELIERGKLKLFEVATQDTFSIDPFFSGKNIQLAVDYNAGDFVTAKITKANISIDRQIQSVRITLANGMAPKLGLDLGIFVTTSDEVKRRLKITDTETLK